MSIFILPSIVRKISALLLGSTPSLALQPDMSFLLALLYSLPLTVQQSVLRYWLGITQVGFSPTVIYALCLAHPELVDYNQAKEPTEYVRIAIVVGGENQPARSTTRVPT